MLGQTISNYKILRQIGSGGMGMVYLAQHATLERYAAVKVLNPEYSSNKFFKERFLHEATTLAKLNHPNIVVLYDFIENDGKLLIIMEYVEGKTLDIIIEENTYKDENYVTRVITQALDGLSYAHRQNVVHRDIKPSNIIVGENNLSKVLDFGIAKLTQSNANLTKAGTRMGSINYMSPEQVLGKEIDARSDIYSMGITLYEFLAGKLPYDANTESDFIVQNKIVNAVLPDVRSIRPEVSQKLAEAINIATEKNPSYRFSNCDEFRDYISGQQNSAGNTENTFNKNQNQNNRTQFTVPETKSNKTVYVEYPHYAVPAPAKKSNALIIGGILFLILIIGGIVVYYINSQDSDVILSGDLKKEYSDSEIEKKKKELDEREKKLNNEEKNLNKNDNQSINKNQNYNLPGKYPEASAKYLTSEDLKYLTKTELQIMRNEIFARHGYIFKTNPQMISYFNNQSWYTPRYNDVNYLLSEIEKSNLDLIKSYEN